uniref:uncharacterized protein LOC122595671 n=1 Tax=Erigeron canadensis TaxID=72917 RepID=UPI001CB93775|nr:uncharacterized protein LOC122595671 [Erigeron canadensis]XP_043624025.1 uncharacterized protein LOC122595671 [Erigeron canadensis]XP_043624026.1 uncharacterized protein LOC122595671 [Erigeron canadensis]
MSTRIIVSLNLSPFICSPHSFHHHQGRRHGFRCINWVIDASVNRICIFINSAFQDVKGSVRSDVRTLLHSRAEVLFQVPLEVNVVLIGFGGDGGYRYKMDLQKLKEFLRVGFPSNRPSCLETGKPLDIEHHMVFISGGTARTYSTREGSKEAMVPVELLESFGI